MANLEDTQESELDLVLSELSLLEAQINCGNAAFLPGATGPTTATTTPTTAIATTTATSTNNGCLNVVAAAAAVAAASTITTPASASITSASSSTASSRTHSRTNSTISGATTISSSDATSMCSSSGISELNGCLPASGSLASVSLASTISSGLGLGMSGGGTGGVGGSGGIIMGNSGMNMIVREPRTESPDNDSAFSDTVSLLSSESSASSSTSSALHQQQMQLQQRQLQQQQQLHHQHQQQQHHNHQQQAQTQLQHQHQQFMALHANVAGGGHTLIGGGATGGGVGGGVIGSNVGNAGNNTKAAKIQLALHKMESASIRRLFVKAFTSDGASKSLLVDERMTCGHVTRLLADKNHVQMQANWALVENLGDLQMERLFEDHELLVDNLMTWNSDAGNRVLFQQRADKLALFAKPEIYLPGPQMAPGCQHDEHTRSMLLEEFFETNSQLQVDGPLYMKADSKKAWKRYHFVLRSSGLYYFPKEKTKNTRDLACLTLFNGNNVYYGLGWKKKLKAPTDYTFGFKSAMDSSLGKTCRTLKMLCAEDLETMEKWLTAIRISKYGKQLWENHKALMEDLCMSDGMSNSSFAVSMRSESISSISSAVPSQCGSVSSAISSMSNSSGRISRASSSSSSGCLSDDNNGFDSEFTTGTIKRKPSMKPNLPLTTMTRQLKEVGEITICESAGNAEDANATSPDRGGTLTRRHSRRKSQESNGSGTLKRRPAQHQQQQQQQQQHNTKRESTDNFISTTTTTAAAAAATLCGSIGSGGGSSSSSNSTPTPTPSICAKPLLELSSGVGVGIVATAQDLMCSSTLSLDSLPPPPPPPALIADEHDVYGSQLSLASLPPPPPPEEVLMSSYAAVAPIPMAGTATAMPNSNGALPPAVPVKPIKPAVKQISTTATSALLGGNTKAAPPYKAPPDYVGPALLAGQQHHHHHQQQQQQQQHMSGSAINTTMNTLMKPTSTISISTTTTTPTPTPTTTTTTTTKKVSFADSPVLLRRKMCSPEPSSSSSSMPPPAIRFPATSSLTTTPMANNHHQQQQQHYSHHQHHNNNNNNQPFYAPGPMLPPRTDLARLSNTSSTSLGDYTVTSPKRLQESASNPPRDFLKDLQRVMRKKWQVAQKCKLEPATTPHEVLGFRDFNNDDLLAAHNLNTAGANSSHYYRETANVSNWVQEHYGAGAAPPPPPHNEYALYENVHANSNGAAAAAGAATVPTTVGVAMATGSAVAAGPTVHIEPQYVSNSAMQQQQPAAVAAAAAAAYAAQQAALRKKRPPPPPPKRSDSTHLTHRV